MKRCAIKVQKKKLNLSTETIHQVSLSPVALAQVVGGRTTIIVVTTLAC